MSVPSGEGVDTATELKERGTFGYFEAMDVGVRAARPAFKR